MKDETSLWLRYAEENLEISRLALERVYINASLQNAQQAVEKALKALLVELRGEIPRTHSIDALMRMCESINAGVSLLSEECNLLDSIYIPSKYPVFGVLPDQFADNEIGLQCLEIAERILLVVRQHVK